MLILFGRGGQESRAGSHKNGAAFTTTTLNSYFCRVGDVCSFEIGGKTVGTNEFDFNLGTLPSLLFQTNPSWLRAAVARHRDSAKGGHIFQYANFVEAFLIDGHSDKYGNGVVHIMVPPKL